MATAADHPSRAECAAASAEHRLAAAVLAHPTESELGLQIYALEIAVLDNALRHFAPIARAARAKAARAR